MTRLERASAQLSEALNNFMTAVAAELAEARATVAPHSHPAPLALLAEHSQGKTAGFDALISQAPKTGDIPTPRLEKLAETPTASPPSDTARPTAPKAARPALKPPAAEVTMAPAPKPAPMAATKAPPAPVDRNCWTPKRLELVQPLYESGTALLDIAVAANGLNGPIVTIQKIQVLAAARGWTRGVTKRAPTEPVIADDTEIRHWAGQRGIVAQGRSLPLEIINAKRLALGMPPFQRAAQRGRAA